MLHRSKQILIYIFIFLLAFGSNLSIANATVEENDGSIDVSVPSTDLTVPQPSDPATEEAAAGEEPDTPPGTVTEVATPRDSTNIRGQLIFNPTDQMYINNFTLAATAFPYLEADTDELSRLSGASEEAIGAMPTADYEKLITDTKAKYFTDSYLKERLLSGSPEMLAILEQILQVPQSSILVQLNDPSQRSNIEVAVDDILAVKIDKRVIETLNYLVRPKNDPRGGAGHLRVKVSRLLKNYSPTDDDKNKSKESDANNEAADQAKQQELQKQTVSEYQDTTSTAETAALLDDAGVSQRDAMVTGEITDSTGGTVEDFVVTDADSLRNISAHGKGQAIDISEIDQIRCTLVKKRRIGDKRIPQPPNNIKLKWQTDQGYSQDSSAINSSYNDLFLNQTRSSLIEMLSEINVDFENMDEIDVSNFNQIAGIIGQAFFASALNTTGNDSVWKFKLSDVLRKIGGVLLADDLSLERAPFLDLSINSINDLSIAIGRYNMEKKLGIPYGSLKGANRDELLANVGRERLSKELKLPAGTINGAFATESDMFQRIGSRLFESEFSFPEGSFSNKSSLAEVQGQVNSYKIRSVFAFPEALDDEFGLGLGTTKMLTEAKITMKQYIEWIAKAHIGRTIMVFQNQNPNSEPDYCTAASIGSALIGGPLGAYDAYTTYRRYDADLCYYSRVYQSQDNASNLTTGSSSTATGAYRNLRDEMFNLPEGTIDKLITGNINNVDYAQAGIYGIVNTLENNDNTRRFLRAWFATPNIDMTTSIKYDNTADYSVGDYVEFMDDTYIMRKNPTEPATGVDPSNSTYWASPGSATPFNPSTTYTIGTLVKDGAQLYVKIGEPATPLGYVYKPDDPNSTLYSTALSNQAVWLPVTASPSYLLPVTTYNTVLGLESQDFYRIFGSSSNSGGIFKRIGEKMLVDALKNTPLASRVSQQIMSNPTIAGAIETYEFYKSRIDTIKSTYAQIVQTKTAIATAFTSVGNDILPQSLKDNYSSLITNFENSTGAAGNSDPNLYNDMASNISKVVDNSGMLDGETASMLNQLKGNTTGTALNLVAKINELNNEVEIVARNAYEIISGTEQPNFRIEDLNASSVTNRLNVDLGSSSMGRGDLLLFLSGKISASDYLISAGSAKLANELNVPPKAFKYAAIAIDRIVTGHSNIKDAFFRGFGMAALEQNVQTSSGQPVTLADSNTEFEQNSDITKTRDAIMSKGKLTQIQANAVLMEGLGLKGYDFEALRIGSFAGWSTARARAEANDAKNHLPMGTTERFVKGESLSTIDESQANSKDIREVAMGLGISESSLQTMIATRNGVANPAINQIYYVDSTTYLQTAQTSQVQNPGGTIAVCAATTTLPAYKYYYYDQDGLHTFDTYAQANEYQIQNTAKKLDYVNEIANGIARKFTSTPSDYDIALPEDQLNFVMDSNQIKARINDYIAKKAGVNSILTEEQIFYVYDLTRAPQNSIDAIFNPAGASTTSVDAVDFFKLSGYSLIKTFITSYLNQSLGISVGEERLTPDDIFSIFSGQSQEVFSRVGGSLLDQELGLERGTSAMMMNPANSSQRGCAMSQAASQLLGQELGIPGLNLDVFMNNSYGTQAVEKFLNFPKDSFKGANLAALRNSVGDINFMKAFSIPYSAEDDQLVNFILTSIGTEYNNINKSKSFYDKVLAIQMYMEGLGTERSVRLEWITSFRNLLNTNVKNTITAFLSFVEKTKYGEATGMNVDQAFEDALLVGHFPDKNAFEVAFKAHLARIANIDSGLGFSVGSTKLLLSSRKSPDQYSADKRSSGMFHVGAQIFANRMGLQERGFSDPEINDLGNLASALAGGTNLNSAQQGAAYNLLTKYFSIDLDNKAGFEAGTIRSMIENPQEAGVILLRAGARRLDQQLGTTDDTGKNGFFGHLTDGLITSDSTFSNECKDSKDAEGKSNYDSCMFNKRKDYAANQALNAVGAIAMRRTNALIAKETGIPFNVIGTDGKPVYGGTSAGINIPVGTLTGIFRGDFRVFMLFGTLMGIKSALVTNCDNPTSADCDPVSNQNFILGYQDVYKAFYGDSEMETYARDRARASAISAINAENASLNAWQDNGADSGYTVDATLNISDANHPNGLLPGGAQQVPTEATTDPTTGDITTTFVSNNTNAFVEAGINAANTLPTDGSVSDAVLSIQDAVGPMPGGDDPNLRAWSTQHNRYLDAQNRINTAERNSVGLVRDLYKSYYTYKLMDGAMNRLDHNIPAGFAWSMFKGNGTARTNAIVGYMENWLLSETNLGEYGITSADLELVRAYINHPTTGNFNNIIDSAATGLLGSQVFDKIDSWLISNSPKVMGLSLQPGTAQALFAWVKTGNINSSYTTASGIKFSSLSEVYSQRWVEDTVCGWADKQLGLPAGTISTSYNLIKDFVKASRAISYYSSASVVTQSAFTTQHTAYCLANGLDPSKFTPENFRQMKLQQSKIQMREVTAAIVTFIITKLFEKQLLALDAKLGLVPGSMAAIVGILVGLAFSVPIIGTIIAIAGLILMNLFGYYDVRMMCTADGNYISVSHPEDYPPLDDNIYDNAHLGVFNATDANGREEGYKAAAKYKASRLIGDLYEMPTETGNKKLVPTQVMTARWEDVDKWSPLLEKTLCANLNRDRDRNVCQGTQAGLWSNIQMQDYTHIGF